MATFEACRLCGLTSSDVKVTMTDLGFVTDEPLLRDLFSLVNADVIKLINVFITPRQTDVNNMICYLCRHSIDNFCNFGEEMRKVRDQNSVPAPTEYGQTHSEELEPVDLSQTRTGIRLDNNPREVEKILDTLMAKCILSSTPPLSPTSEYEHVALSMNTTLNSTREDYETDEDCDDEKGAHSLNKTLNSMRKDYETHLDREDETYDQETDNSTLSMSIDESLVTVYKMSSTNVSEENDSVFSDSAHQNRSLNRSIVSPQFEVLTHLKYSLNGPDIADNTSTASSSSKLGIEENKISLHVDGDPLGPGICENVNVFTKGSSFLRTEVNVSGGQQTSADSTEILDKVDSVVQAPKQDKVVGFNIVPVVETENTDSNINADKSKKSKGDLDSVKGVATQMVVAKFPQCLVCGITCKSNAGLQAHYRFTHQEQYLAEKESTGYKCGHCTQHFVSSALLKEHKLTLKSIGMKFQTCPICSQRIGGNGGNMTTHMKAHLARQCPYCDVDFKTTKSLTRHLAKIHGINLFPCSSRLESPRIRKMVAADALLSSDAYVPLVRLSADQISLSRGPSTGGKVVATLTKTYPSTLHSPESTGSQVGNTCTQQVGTVSQILLSQKPSTQSSTAAITMVRGSPEPTVSQAGNPYTQQVGTVSQGRKDSTSGTTIETTKKSRSVSRNLESAFFQAGNTRGTTSEKQQVGTVSQGRKNSTSGTTIETTKKSRSVSRNLESAFFQASNTHGTTSEKQQGRSVSRNLESAFFQAGNTHGTTSEKQQVGAVSQGRKNSTSGTTIETSKKSRSVSRNLESAFFQAGNTRGTTSEKQQVGTVAQGRKYGSSGGQVIGISKKRPRVSRSLEKQQVSTVSQGRKYSSSCGQVIASPKKRPRVSRSLEKQQVRTVSQGRKYGSSCGQVIGISKKRPKVSRSLEKQQVSTVSQGRKYSSSCGQVIGISKKRPKVSRSLEKQQVSTVSESLLLYMCNLCPESFGSQTELSRHVTVLHLSKNISHACRACKTPIHRERHAGHIRSHGPLHKLDYVCNHCGETLKQFNSLFAHVGMHTNRKPFKCGRCSKVSFFAHLNAQHVFACKGEAKPVDSDSASVSSKKTSARKHFRLECEECGEMYRGAWGWSPYRRCKECKGKTKCYGGPRSSWTERNSPLMLRSKMNVSITAAKEQNSLANMDEQDTPINTGKQDTPNNMDEQDTPNNKDKKHRQVNFPCTLCEKSFAHPRFLGNHMRSHKIIVEQSTPSKPSRAPKRRGKKHVQTREKHGEPRTPGNTNTTNESGYAEHLTT